MKLKDRPQWCDDCGHELECEEGFEHDPAFQKKWMEDHDGIDCWRPDGCLLVWDEVAV